MSDKPPIKRQPEPLPPELAAFFTPEHLERRRQAMARYTGWEGADALDPKCPSGHAEGVRTSTLLTRQYRETHRKQAMNILPQDVIDVLVAAGVKNWVLMGLHGYVGYLPSPRATQDVDVMVPYTQRTRAEAGLARASRAGTVASHADHGPQRLGLRRPAQAGHRPDAASGEVSRND